MPPHQYEPHWQFDPSQGLSGKPKKYIHADIRYQKKVTIQHLDLRPHRVVYVLAGKETYSHTKEKETECRGK